MTVRCPRPSVVAAAQAVFGDPPAGERHVAVQAAIDEAGRGTILLTENDQWDIRANRVASFLVGLPILMSATAYRITHTYHHFELGKRRDLGTYRQHSNGTAFVWLAYIAQLTAGSILYMLLIPYFAWKFGSRHSRRTVVVEYSIVVGAYTLFFTLVPGATILHYWFLPLLVMNVLTNVRGIASNALGDVENIFLSSRTVSCPRWVSFLLLHENYHLEHHLFPRVPSYHLHRLHRLIWNRLPEAVYSKSYLSFLTNFVRAALRRDLQPMGVVRPAEMKGGGAC